MLLKAPELCLSKDEADMLGSAAAEVAKHYPTQFDPKIAAWVNLGMASAMIYGPKVFAIRARRRGGNADRVSNDAHSPMPDFGVYGGEQLTM